jgi:hypothetical protein
MKKLIVMLMVVFLLLGLLAVAAQAATLQSNSGKVILFKSEDLMDFAMSHLADKGSPMDPTFLSTIAALVDNGTRCSIIKSKFTRKLVRVLEGRFKGTVGWTPMEMVRP